MKTFELFFPHVLPDVPGVNEPAAELALLKAAREFCERTRAWRVTLDPTGISAGIDEYDLELPAKSELVRIESAKRGTVDVKVAMPNAPLGRNEAWIECLDGRTLTVNPVPAAAASLVLNVTLKPSLSAVGVEDYLFERYADVISLHAIAALKRQAGKTYTDVAGAVDPEARFNDQCADIRNLLWRGSARNAPRSRAVFY